MEYENLTFERRGEDGRIALVTLNRPEKLNALSRGLQEDTRAACAEVGADDSIRAMVVTGAGRGFCSGADLTGPRVERDGVPPQNERLDEMGWVGKQALAFYNLDKPTIAAVNGYAAGAGMSLSLACDMRVGSEHSRFRAMFVERSLSPDSGMSFFLPNIIGYSRAFDLITTARGVDADEAHRIGLLDRLVAADDLVDEAVTLADQIAFWPPMAIRSAKRTIQRNLSVTLEQALLNERLGLITSRIAPHDAKESGLSFREKRPPKFTGE